MKKTEKFNDYKLVHNFMYPNEPLKEWITEDSFNNIFIKDWNSLMELVHKIRKLGFYVSLRNWYDKRKKLCSWIEIEINEDKSIIERKESEINNVFNACLKFIKWYNKNKTNEK